MRRMTWISPAPHARRRATRARARGIHPGTGPYMKIFDTLRIRTPAALALPVVADDP
jgi:hypothetical protein